MQNDSGSTRFGERTMGDLAASLPGATSVFRAFKLDYCCGGDVTLENAARQRGLDPETVACELKKLIKTAAVSAELDTRAMISEILTRYHEVNRRELPELFTLACKVEAVHGDHLSAPHGLADILQEMIGELEVHMKKEELILFPAKLRNAGSPLSAPISHMRHEHDDHGTKLRRLDEITNGFTLPEDACRSWQALYASTRKLSDDLMEHIYLENNILFPRFEAER